jgi:hypothetical protein
MWTSSSFFHDDKSPKGRAGFHAFGNHSKQKMNFQGHAECGGIGLFVNSFTRLLLELGATKVHKGRAMRVTV